MGRIITFILISFLATACTRDRAVYKDFVIEKESLIWTTSGDIEIKGPDGIVFTFTSLQSTVDSKSLNMILNAIPKGPIP